jgi:hypothetical protein
MERLQRAFPIEMVPSSFQLLFLLFPRGRLGRNRLWASIPLLADKINRFDGRGGKPPEGAAIS